MANTNVKAEFIILGDSFEPIDITTKLGLDPTQVWRKGDVTKTPGFTHEETCWMISTDFEESYDVNDQLSQLVELLIDKLPAINDLRNTDKIQCMFLLIINIENNETPAMYFRHDFLEFLNLIKAELHVDQYIF